MPLGCAPVTPSLRVRPDSALLHCVPGRCPRGTASLHLGDWSLVPLPLYTLHETPSSSRSDLCLVPSRRAPGWLVPGCRLGQQSRGPPSTPPGPRRWPPTWWGRALRRRARLCARGSCSGSGLPGEAAAVAVAAAAAVTTGRSREQRFPPQRSAASDRPYTARERSPAPLPAPVAPSLPPPSVAGSGRVRSGGGRRGGRRGGAEPRVGAAPTAGSPGNPSQPSPAARRERPGPGGQEALDSLGGKSRALKIPNQSFSFLIRRRGRGKGGLAGDDHPLSF